ncbi:MAG TPA: helix-turn-helix domain-containing protein [Hyphomicrobiaceae bacterium]|nr:helix-turn-helix domain-containing protein [Hyphomicrobiaceae bacterium]
MGKRAMRHQPQSDEERLLPDEAAAYLGHTVATMREWRSRGRGPAYFKAPDGSISYAKSDLDAFKETRKPRRIVPGEKRSAA